MTKNHSVEDFINSLESRYRADCNSGIKDYGRRVESVAGPKRFYRFAGYNESGRENAIFGPWWFSQTVFDSWVGRCRQNGGSLAGMARALLALPDSWNTKENLFEMIIPNGARVEALVGQGRHQPSSGKREAMILDSNGKMEKNNVFLIGGDEQYYFRVDDINSFSVSRLSIKI